MRMKDQANGSHRIRPSSGLSIVELLVGIAIGLFILAGATLVTSTQLSDNRQLLLETQIQQDLRATADLITREIRRSGYWGRASTTAWPAAQAPVNMYQKFETDMAGDGGREKEIRFWYSKALSAGAEDGIVGEDEKFGFALNKTTGTVDAKVGNAGWQAMTDPSVLTIVQFAHPVTEEVLVVPCAKYCGSPVVPGDTSCWPRQKVRDLLIQLTGKAVHDPNVVRTVQSGVRLRNDEVTGNCPT